MRRFAGVFLAAVIAAPVVISAVATTPAQAAGTPLYPDLKTLPARELRFDRADVSADLSGDFHNVLRFSNDTYNAGDGPLILNAKIDPSTLRGPTTQRVMNSDGSFSDFPLNNDMYWHAAHHHYHFDNWGDYQLWSKTTYDNWIASGRTVGSPLYSGAKTTSCVTDEEFITSVAASVYPGPYGLGGCQTDGQGNIHMGLSVGWGDTYDWYRQLQWIDFGQSTLGSGTYVLRSVADPLNIVYESANKGVTSRESVSDNEATRTFVVSGTSILDSDAPNGTVSINHVDPSTTNAAVSVDVIGRDDVSGPSQFRLSNDGTTFKTYSYTSSGSTPTTVSWNLTDAAYGGNTSTGLKTVYAQVKDNSGKWGPTFTDTIQYGSGGPPPPPPPPPSGPYADAVMGDNPSGYWRLDETSGLNAADSFGSNPGTYKNGVTLGRTSLLTSDPDKAAGFNGTNQYVSIPSSGPLAPASTVTEEAWIKPTAIPSGFASVLTKPESYSLQFNAGRMEFTIMQGGTRRRLQAPAGAIVAGGTYHVVGTFDGNTQRLYINGSQVASAVISPGITVNTSALNIASWDGGQEFFNGTIDEAAVYPVALTASQVAIHYADGTQASGTTSQLSVSRTGTGGGNVTSNPAGIDCGTTCSHAFSTGTSVTLTAAASSGSTFAGWSGGGCSGTGTCTLTVNSNVTVTATFTLTANPTLTIAKSGTGTGGVTSNPAGINCGSTCSASFPPGTSITLTAAADVGSTFTGWSGGGCSGTGTCTLTLNSNTTVTAGFSVPVPNPTLTVTKSGNGTGGVTSNPAGIDCGSTCSASFPPATSITLTAAADAGSTFAGWSGGGCTGTGTCTFTLNANTTVNAAFSITGSGPTYPQAVTGDAPISYWRLNELSGSTAADSAGSNPGTYSGATLGAPGLLASVNNTAASFAGSGKVTVASSAALSPASRVSVEAWIKPSALPATGAFASVATKAESYSLQFNGPKLEFTIMQAGTRRRLQAPTGAVAVGGVYHVVGTYDGSTQRLYINGTQVISAALTGAITTNANPFYIASWNGSSEFFRGTLDEVAVYSTALTSTQVSNHYSAGINSLVAFVQNPASTQLMAVSKLAASRHAGVGGSTPVAVAYDNGLHRAYVTGNADKGHAAGTRVTIFDSRTWRSLGSVHTSPTAGASAVAVDPVTHLVYVTSAVYTPFDVHGSVKVIDGRTGKLGDTIATGLGPKAIVVNAATHRLYVTEQTGTDGDLAIAVIDTTTGKLITAVPIGPYGDYYDNPFGLAVNAKTNTVYASNPLDGYVYTLDGATNSVRRVAVGGEPGGIAVNTVTNQVFVTGARNVTVLNGRSASVVRRVASGSRTRGIAVDVARNKIYATTNGGGFLVIDGRTLNAGQVLTHGLKPNGIAIDPANGTIVVANGFNANVSVYNDDRAAGIS
jgi:DNA-binding beta-propeller fold protein YncE